MNDAPVTGLRRAFRNASVAHVSIDLQDFYCNYANRHNWWTDKAKAAKLTRLAAAVDDFAKAQRGTPLRNIWVAHTVGELRKEFRLAGSPRRSLEILARRELAYRLHPQKDDIVIAKKHFDAFKQTRLDRKLRQNGVDTLLLSGIFLNVCVEETAKSAARLGYDTYIIEDLVTPGSADTLESCKERLAGIGVKSIASAEVAKLARA